MEDMTPIQYIRGDATAPLGDGPKVIVHICNDVGAWAKGFVLAISKRWPEPERQYRAWSKRSEFGLGQVQFVTVAPDLWVANLVGQTGIGFRHGVPIRYDAVRMGLGKVADFVLGTKGSVHMPRIGCGLAQGKWGIIEPIILSTLSTRDISVIVYDYGR